MNRYLASDTHHEYFKQGDITASRWRESFYKGYQQGLRLAREASENTYGRILHEVSPEVSDGVSFGYACGVVRVFDSRFSSYSQDLQDEYFAKLELVAQMISSVSDPSSLYQTMFIDDGIRDILGEISGLAHKLGVID